MLPFLALQAIAAPRGEGLRPELLEKLRCVAGNPEFDLPSTKSGWTVSIYPKPDSSALSFIDTPAKGLDQPIDVRGTPFRQRVWGALLGIPAGSTVTYAALAARIGEPKSAHAVANACADIADALAIPCHRVLRSNGTLSGPPPVWRAEARWSAAKLRFEMKRLAERLSVSTAARYNLDQH